MEFRWFCRQKSETWCNDFCPEGRNQLLYENGAVLPATRPQQAEKDANKIESGIVAWQKGGCFGNGPGAINFTLGMLTLESQQFLEVDVEYEMLLEVR